jgi:hypothetical protein
MGKAVIKLLSDTDIVDNFQLLLPLVKKPLERMGAEKGVTPSHVLQRCLTLEWQCWATTNFSCIFITQIVIQPTGYRTLNIYLIGGAGLGDWLESAWDVFKNFGRHTNCSEIVGRGRKGWVKALQKIEPKKLDIQYRISVEI